MARILLEQANGYRAGDRVRLLVETIGGDANDVERTYPVGTTGVIVDIEQFDNDQGVTFTLVIGPTDADEAIVNVFDELDGPPSEFFIQLPASETA